MRHLWYYRILIISFVWEYAVCRVFPFPGKLSHQWVHLLQQLHVAAGITHAITTANSQQSTDSFLCSEKKSREKQLNTQNVYACLLMYTPNVSSVWLPLIESQLGQPLCCSQRWMRYNSCLQVHSLERKTYIVFKNPTWGIYCGANRYKA